MHSVCSGHSVVFAYFQVKNVQINRKLSCYFSTYHNALISQGFEGVIFLAIKSNAQIFIRLPLLDPGFCSSVDKWISLNVK